MTSEPKNESLKKGNYHKHKKRGKTEVALKHKNQEEAKEKTTSLHMPSP